MPAPIYGLSESDVALIKELIADRKRNVIRTRSRYQEELLPSTPEVYIALTSPGGILPLTYSLGKAYPGYSQCTIYQLIPLLNAGTHTPYATQLELVNITPQIVYNISTLLIESNQYIAIQRDKFGKWITSGCILCVTPAGTGTGTHMATGCCTGKVVPQHLCLHFPNSALGLPFTTTLNLLSGPPNLTYTGTWTDAFRHTHSFTLMCGIGLGGIERWSLTFLQAPDNPSGQCYPQEIIWDVVTPVVCDPFSIRFYPATMCGSPITPTITLGSCTPGTGSAGTGTHSGGGCTGTIYTTTGCCPSQCIPSPLHLTIGGACTGVNGTYTLTYNSSSSSWVSNTITCGGHSIRFEFACINFTPTNFGLNYYVDGVLNTQIPASTVTCPSPGPFSAQGNIVFPHDDGCCVAEQTNTWTVGL